MRKHSQKQEKYVAKKIKGKTQPNSGATPFRKGDVVSKHFLIECKTAIKEKQSMAIKKEWIEKTREEAFGMGKPYSALCFNFGGLERNKNFYIIDENLFTVLLNFLED